MIKKEELQNFPIEIRTTVSEMQNRIVFLTEENNRLRREIFGSSAEKHKTSGVIQPEGALFNEPEAIIEAENKKENETALSEENQGEKEKKRSENSGGRKPFSEKIERKIIIIDLPEEEKFCAVSGEPLKKIGEEVTEKLEIIPAKVHVNQYVVYKYACSCGKCQKPIFQSSITPSPIPGASCDIGLLVFVCFQKYLNSLPLYRIEKYLEELGADVSRVSMARWMIQLAELLNDLAFEIKAYILNQTVIHADETTVQVLNEPEKTAQSKSYMWMICSTSYSHPAVWFQYETGRSSLFAKALLQTFSGLLHIDGYDGYSRVISENKITRIGCWAHVRRKFDVAKIDGAKDGKLLASKFLDHIQELFIVEREIQGKPPDEILAKRKIKSALIVQIIKELLDKNIDRIPPKSKNGVALTYLKNQWQHLVQFLEHGEASLSNNRIENHVRPFAIGRKNWLFANSQTGANASATLYTIIQTAKANQLSIEKYLRKILTELPKLYAQKSSRIDFKPLLPWNCQDCSLTNQNNS
jgi:transposase